MMCYLFSFAFLLASMKFGLANEPWICGIMAFSSIMFGSMGCLISKEKDRNKTFANLLSKGVCIDEILEKTMEKKEEK